MQPNQQYSKEIRFIVAIFVLIAIMIIVSKLNSFYQITAMQQITNKIFEVPYKASNATLHIQSEVFKMHRDMKDVVLSNSNEEMQKYIDKVNEHEKHVYRYLYIVQQSLNDAEGKQLEQESRKIFIEWKPIRDNVITLMRNNHIAEAIAITKGIGANHVLKLENATLRLNQYAENKALYFENNSDSMLTNFYYISILNGAITLLLLSLIAYYTINRITRYLGKNIHLTDVLMIIRNVNQLIVREKNIQKLVQETCDILVSNQVYSNAWIVLYDKDQGVKYISSTDTSENFTALKNKMNAGWMPPCTLSEADRTKGYVRINNTKQNCPECPFTDLYDNKGAFSIQLIYNEKLYGNLTLSVNTLYLNDQDEISLLLEVAGDIAYAIYNLETEEHLKEKECSLFGVKELYENIIDSVDNILFVKDTNFTYIVCNQAFEKFVGKSNHEIIGKNDYELFEKDVADFFREHDIRMLEENTSKSNFEWVPYPDGNMIYLYTVKSPLHDSKGKLLGLVGNSVDFTEQKMVEEALKEIQERFASLMHQSPSAIELYDLDGTQIEVNHAYEELWGFSAEHTINKFNLFKSEEVKSTGLMYYVERAYAGEALNVPPYKYDPTGSTEAAGKGRVRWLSTRIYPLKDLLGNVKNIVITHEDITEEIRSKEKLLISQENYQLLADNSIDMIWKMDMSIAFTYVNPTVKGLLGYEIDEFIGTKLDQHFPPEEFKSVETIISEILRTNSEESESLEINMYKKDGSIIPLEVNGKLIFDESHTPIGFQGSARDFTTQTESRKKLKEALSSLEKKSNELQTILQEAPNPIMLHNENGKVVMVNRVWQSLSGYTYEEIDTVEKWAELACSKTKPLMHEFMEKMYSLEHKIDMGEATVTTKEGNTLIWKFSSAPLGLIDGSQTVVTTAMDITELKKKDELMMAQSRHAAMGEMIGMIAHQWRQPIAGIAMDANNMLLDIAFESFDNTAASEYAQNILDQTDHLSKTIDDFRNFFKPDKSVLAVTIEEIIQNTLTIVKESFTNNSIAINTSYESKSEVNAYPRELMQVFLNVINNAKDALISNNSIDARIDIHVYDDGEYVSSEICDNAGGIDVAILPKIFDPYFSTKDEKTGTGLGLYMSKMIIEDHLHGFIEASNNPIGGACFKIRLLKKSDDQSNPQIDHEH